MYIFYFDCLSLDNFEILESKKENLYSGIVGTIKKGGTF